MGSHRFILLLVILTAYLVTDALGSVISRPCSEFPQIPAVWLNSSTQVTKIVGNQFTAYARKPDGTPHISTWHSMAWYEVQELAMIPSASDPSRMKCAAGFTTPEGALPVLLRALDTETACTCTQTTGTRPFQQGIAEQFVEVEVTRPDWPDFKLTVTFSLVNESWFTTVPASPETFDIQYDLHWTTQAPKISFQISNWNWTSPGNATSSLRLYFLETGMLCLKIFPTL